jgi:hypothetical protein
MKEAHEDLQATAEDVSLDAQLLQRIEDEKLRLDPSNPRVLDLSEQAVRIAEGLHAKTVAERDLAEQAVDEELEDAAGA